MIVLYILLGIILIGLVNYLIRRLIAKNTYVPWFNPKNLIEINGIKTHIVVKGSGEPLLLVHGSQMNIYDFRNNINFFSKYFRVYAFDMVGCGFTDKPKGEYTPEYFADFINSIMLHYSIEKASFIASSWGGGHVYHFALIYPQKVNKIVMSSPCGFKHEMLSSYNLLSIPLLGSLVLLFNMKALVRNELNKSFHDRSFVDKELVNAVYLPFYTKGCIYSTTRSARSDDFSFVENNLEKINVPVLLIWGSSDKVHQKWMMDEMNKRLSNSELLIFNSVGHLAHEEAADRFNIHALEFLNKN